MNGLARRGYAVVVSRETSGPANGRVGVDCPGPPQARGNPVGNDSTQRNRPLTLGNVPAILNRATRYQRAATLTQPPAGAEPSFSRLSSSGPRWPARATDARERSAAPPSARSRPAPGRPPRSPQRPTALERQDHPARSPQRRAPLHQPAQRGDRPGRDDVVLLRRAPRPGRGRPALGRPARGRRRSRSGRSTRRSSGSSRVTRRSGRSTASGIPADRRRCRRRPIRHLPGQAGDGDAVQDVPIPQPIGLPGSDQSPNHPVGGQNIDILT